MYYSREGGVLKIRGLILRWERSNKKFVTKLNSIAKNARNMCFKRFSIRLMRD